MTDPLELFTLTPFLLEGASAAGLGVMNAGISGAASGAVSTGTFKGTVLAAAEAMAFSEIGTIKEGNAFLKNWAVSAVMHATAGGLFSVAEGGKFQSGFLAAGFADLAGTHFDIDGDGAGAIAVNTVTHGVIGGLGAVMGSGKFENGAVTGAFGYLFNELGKHSADDNRAATYDERVAFYKTYGPAIMASATADGACPVCVVTQAGVESNFGISPGATKYNNLFGIDDTHPDHTLTIHQFDTWEHSIDKFFEGWGKTVSGTSDIDTYAHRLEDGPNIRYNSRDPAGYVKTLDSVYRDTVLPEMRSLGMVK